jgi:hypothetical protein
VKAEIRESDKNGFRGLRLGLDDDETEFWRQADLETV